MSEIQDTRYLRILKNLDALGCTLIAKRAKTCEYISTYVWRVRKAWAVKLINRLFKDPNHCRDSFEGQKGPLGLEMDKPDCLFCAYGYAETRRKFDIAAAVVAALGATTIPVNTVQINSKPLTGSGTPADPMRPA